MAMDAALVAAYRSAKMADVPKDTVGAAMASLQDSLTEAAANIAAAKAKEQRKAEAKAKRDAEIRQAQASKWSGMGKSIADASQGGRDKSTGQVNTTNLRSRSKGGLLNKKPKKKKVMKRGGLASKK